MTLEQTLDKLAKTLVDKASQDATSLQESIDAFKALTAYYAAKQRHAKKAGDEDDADDGFSFAGSNEVSNDSRNPQVRARRNS